MPFVDSAQIPSGGELSCNKGTDGGNLIAGNFDKFRKPLGVASGISSICLGFTAGAESEVCRLLCCLVFNFPLQRFSRADITILVNNIMLKLRCWPK
jgi:hypothetical protein